MGQGLPIFVDNAQVNITGQQPILEVILLLLLYESVHLAPGICILSCDHSALDGWKLKVQTTTLDQSRVDERGSNKVNGHRRSNRIAVEDREGGEPVCCLSCSSSR